MKGSMDRVQRGGPWTGSTGVVHGPGVLYTSTVVGLSEQKVCHQQKQ